MKISTRINIWFARLREVLSDWILMWRYRNKPYLEYYRSVMQRNTRVDPKAAVGGHWESVGPMQFERLLRYGLKPNQTLFDFGCGSLRGGLYFINYLEVGNYTGNDISPEILEAARRYLKEANLEHKKPKLILTDNLRFNELANQKFDYLHAQSVLSHMPPEDIEELFKNIPKLMHENSQFLVTFFLASGNKIYPGNQRRNFFYPLSWLQQIGAASGLKVEMVETDQKQKLMRITLTH